MKTYQPSIYKTDGGTRQVFRPGAILEIQDGAIFKNATGVGAKNGASVSVSEQAGLIHETVLTFDDQTISVVDTGGANGGQGSLKIYDFPAGMIEIIDRQVDLTVSAATGIGATAALVGSLGTAAAGASNATLTATEADICPSIAGTLADSDGVLKSVAGPAASVALGIVSLTDNSAGTPGDTIAALPTLTDSPATQDALRDDLNTNVWPVLKNWIASVTAKVNAILASTSVRLFLDGTGTAKDCYLNIAVPNADISATADVTLNGTITLRWINHGDT